MVKKDRRSGAVWLPLEVEIQSSISDDNELRDELYLMSFSLSYIDVVVYKCEFLYVAV